MKTLVTGGAGYIGSHTSVELLAEGFEPVILDNLSNSSYEAVSRVEAISGKKVKFYKTDLLDAEATRDVFKKEKPECVIHFAGLKAVGESVRVPLAYYRNNITGTLNLLEAMKDFGVRKIIFSSSATVYGLAEKLPLTESSPAGGTTNPYGTTKLVIEWILKDLYESDKSFDIISLRYFNPVGAHESGLIGENPTGIPNNLMPYITQVASGKLEKLQVFGDDYPTRDGSGVRDYIHVVDLAAGHIKALQKINGAGFKVYNLGTGRGASVFEMISAFEAASGVKIPFETVARRAGDIAECYADPSLARRELGFEAKKTLTEMCADSWNWQSKNPRGYEK